MGGGLMPYHSLFKLYRAIRYFQHNHPRWQKPRMVDEVVSYVQRRADHLIQREEEKHLRQTTGDLVDLLDLIKEGA